MSATIFHNLLGAPDKVAPFSHAVECEGWIQLTGQMPTNPEDNSKPLPEGIEAQTRRVLDNLSIVLDELGLDLSHVLSCRVYLAEFHRDFDAMNLVYQDYFQPGRLPARTCVGVTCLALGALVEVDMVAKRPN